MKFLRTLLDWIEPSFSKGGKFERLHPLFEAGDTFLYTPGSVTKGMTHIRDALDLKRMMTMVVLALIPCTLFGMWNIGYQANLANQSLLAKNIEPAFDWHHAVQSALGLTFLPDRFLDCFVLGVLHFLPIYIVCMTVGGLCEVIFSVVRKHEINEGFLVTGLLFPLTLPPNIPLWQVAIGIAFGVVIGKEIFGGTGRNFLNPALTARCFLYFAYSAQITGNVWIASRFVSETGVIDGYSGATALGQLAVTDMDEFPNPIDSLSHVITTGGEQSITWTNAFLGTIPGSIGETSTLCCLFGAFVLIATRIGSWKIMASVCLGALAISTLFYAIGSETNAMFNVAPWWHFVIGGFAFGTVFMATDPVSASMTETGKWFYGALIGGMTILIRVVNPAFPEGIMLAILFANVFAPFIDYCVVQANIHRRAARYAN